jgi:hypothetical protein
LIVGVGNKTDQWVAWGSRSQHAYRYQWQVGRAKKNNKILKSNFKVIRSRSGLFRLKFFEIKYGYEGFVVRISFP